MRISEDLPIDELRAESDLFGDDIAGALDLDAIVAARTTRGGTAPSAVAEQLAKVEGGIADDSATFGGLSPVVEMGRN